ncbi:MAG: methyltransferase domain-containing protein [Euryhalocaulis sp.]|uniref:methyltransferase domain-containing protein n=1 Tax=Euryhalocaulis sp. TaxID=2744307 RepID=UPI0018141203|nr:methyltransferase domain-containing protein [Euryhalocaulis sp.]MBA4801727.1 methyltransferase domain-containing protein [Euryhalocaulis sp.]
MSGPAPFDRSLLRLRRDRAAGRIDAHDFLIREAVKDSLERAAFTTRSFDRALAIGGAGLTGEEMAAGPMADRIGWLAEMDLSPRMAMRTNSPAFAANEESLPLAEDSLDLVLAPLGLHWINDLPGALIQIRRALKPDGLFIGSMFAAGTLAELRECLTEAELEITGGAAARIAPFADVRDAGGLLQRAGFAMPVSDLDRRRVVYRDPARLFHDLRGMGETASLSDRAPALKRSVFARALALYAERYAEEDGRLPATFVIANISGWAPAPDQPRPKAPGSATVRLADALGAEEMTVDEKASPHTPTKGRKP